MSGLVSFLQKFDVDALSVIAELLFPQQVAFTDEIWPRDYQQLTEKLLKHY